MFSNLYGKQLFSKLFTLGLLLLFIGILTENFRLAETSDFFIFNSVIFLTIGTTLCLISFLFLLIEWVVLPFGTQTKRIKLYQGLGNLLAFAMLIGGWLFREDSSQNLVSQISLGFSAGGLLIAIIFSWMGKSIADFISRKEINLKSAQETILLSKIRADERRIKGNKIASDISRLPAVQN